MYSSEILTYFRTFLSTDREQNYLGGVAFFETRNNLYIPVNYRSFHSLLKQPPYLPESF